MKKILLFLLLISNFVYSQDNTDVELDRKLDSLRIYRFDKINSNLELKNKVVDLFNIYLYNGDYSKIESDKFTKQLNLAQQEFKFDNKFSSEKSTLEIKDVFIEYITLSNRAEKYRLIGNRLAEIRDENIKRDNERVLVFLRETGYSPIEFKKLDSDAKLKIVEKFEMQKDGVTDEIIAYYKTLNDDELEYFNYFIKRMVVMNMSRVNDISKYSRLVNDNVIALRDKWDKDYYPTYQKGEKIITYIKKWKPKGY